MIDQDAPQAAAAAAGPDARAMFLRGAGHALSGPAISVAASLIGVGGLARDAGQSIGVAVLATLLVWASPAQIMYFTGVASGAAPLAVAFAILLVGFRFLPMSVSLLPLLRAPGTRATTLLAASHLVALTVWVELMWRLPRVALEARQPYYFGFALSCITLATGFTAAGYWLVALLPASLAAALLFLSPAYFIFALTRGARGTLDWAALALGLALMPLATFAFGGNFDLMAVGLVGGGLAYGLHRLRRGAMP